MTYNNEKDGETVRSALTSFQLNKAHCLEACLLAAAILEHRNYAPIILSLDSKDHLNHVLMIFKTKTGWGSIGRSRCEGLHGREPRFRSIKDLVWTYYDPFIDKTGKLVGYTVLNLDDSKTDWRFSKKNLWKLERFVVNVKFTPMKSSQTRYLRELRRYEREGYQTSGPSYWW